MPRNQHSVDNLNAAFILQRMSGLSKAIQIVGRRSLAKQLDVTNMAISQWLKRGVPPARAIQIEAATGGAVTREELRPDLFAAPRAQFPEECADGVAPKDSVPMPARSGRKA